MIKHHLLKLLSSFGTIFFSIFLASHFNQCYLFLIGKDNKGILIKVKVMKLKEYDLVYNFLKLFL